MESSFPTLRDTEPHMKTNETTAHDGETRDRPTHVPEKFWDTELGNIRTDALLKSYSELENRMGDNPHDVPANADEYDLVIDHQAFDIDPETNTRLHTAGFSQEQAQLVYDLAKEKLLPLMENMTGSMERRTEEDRLKSHFGGQQKWQGMSRQISNWGRKQLPADAFNVLSSSYDGVMAMHRMMISHEPAILGNQGRAFASVTEEDLKRMMHDPRYWRTQEPAFIEQVRQGFQTLYPG